MVRSETFAVRMDYFILKKKINPRMHKLHIKRSAYLIFTSKHLVTLSKHSNVVAFQPVYVLAQL